VYEDEICVLPPPIVMWEVSVRQITTHRHELADLLLGDFGVK